MFNSKFNTLLTVLLVIAIIGIIAIIGFFGYSIYNRYFIETGAKDAVESFEQAVGNTVIEQPTDVNENVTLGDGTFENLINNNSSNNSSLKYYGYNILGVITIPKINIEYPILDKPTDKALKVAVVYLSGAGINKVGNTVIQGHNYRNSLFFSNLHKLSNGDKIYIKDTSGTKITYEVYKNFTAKGTDATFYNRDTAGKREITLSTCTQDKTIKTIVLAREV